MAPPMPVEEETTAIDDPGPYYPWLDSEGDISFDWIAIQEATYATSVGWLCNFGEPCPHDCIGKRASLCELSDEGKCRQPATKDITEQLKQQQSSRKIIRED